MKMDLGTLSVFPLLPTIKALQTDDGEILDEERAVLSGSSVCSLSRLLCICSFPIGAQWSAALVTTGSAPLWF